MNQEAYGCFACAGEDFTPIRFAGTFDPMTDFWNNLDGMGKGILVSGILLIATFIAIPFLKKRRK